MTTRNIPCSLSKLTGCQGFVSQRGNIMCDKCTELRKSLTRTKREQTLDDLLSRNKELEKTLQSCKEQCNFVQKELEETKSKLESKHENYFDDYNTQLEKENCRLTEIIFKLRTEIENHVRDKAEYEMTHHQIKLDIEKLTIENERLDKTNKELVEQNRLLMKENSLAN